MLKLFVQCYVAPYLKLDVYHERPRWVKALQSAVWLSVVYFLHPHTDTKRVRQ